MDGLKRIDRFWMYCLVLVACGIGIWKGWSLYQEWTAYKSAHVVIGTVNIATLVTEYQRSINSNFGASLGKGNTDSTMATLVARNAEFGQTLSGVLQTVANECNCVLLNSAAILMQPTTSNNIQDYTDRVRQLLGANNAN